MARLGVAGLVAAILVALAGPVGARDRSGRDDWASAHSDVRVDSAFRFGRLPNGLRYVLRRNGTPAGTAVVRLDVAVGALDEGKREQGYAHFIEHMAFNGSTQVPEGNMVPLLERWGLAFGADTNASTGFDRTVYKLDLPTAAPNLVDTAIMLMRETASELTIAPDAVARERGVILSELRDRDTWRDRDAVANTAFFYPRSRFAERFPIGTSDTLNAATADKLRAFYRREYVPAKMTLVVVGDIDIQRVEEAIQLRFAPWKGVGGREQPDAGPVRDKDHGRATIYLDPAVSERVTFSRNGRWLDEPDTIAQRRENLLRRIGYGIINRRFQRLSRTSAPPFRSAGLGTGNVFETARSTRLIVDTIDRKWRRGVLAAVGEYRRALSGGFSDGEVAEQVAAIRSALEDAAGGADTRSNAALADAALALLSDRIVPAAPADALARFQGWVGEITPDAVIAALRRELVPLDEPLIRFRGRTAPAGGVNALRKAWADASGATPASYPERTAAPFAYTSFGPPGTVVSDTREPILGIRQVRFANGVMLNLKRTMLEKDRVRATLSLDGGDRLNTMDNPLATEMMPFLDEGGLGKHSADALQTIMAGRNVGDTIATGSTSFDAQSVTTPRDLELQLQLWAAILTEPGYRIEGEVRYRQNANNYFKQLRATPSSALQAELGGIVSDRDPRFSLLDVSAYRALTFAKLKRDMADRLDHGAIEIGLAGDIDEDASIALVAATFGALPAREEAFHDAPQAGRIFTADRSRRVIRHAGPRNQALLRLTWPTRDDADPVEVSRLELLERVVQIELTDNLREALGKAYSPSAASSPSHAWKDYGVFGIAASIDVQDITAARTAIRATLLDLRTKPLDPDVLRRARQPMMEGLQNALKSNGGWSSLVARAQSEPEWIARYRNAQERLQALTATDVQAAAQRYLDPGSALEVLVLPDGVEPPPEP